MSAPADRLDVERVRHIVPLGHRGRPSPVERDGATPSAVLVPLFPDDAGALSVLLTRRSWNLRTHRGEVSFPGGRTEPGETAADAAVREAFEEVGVQPDTVEPLGELDHLTTVTRRAYIVPVVGLLPGPPALRVNRDEVDAALVVPLAELLHPEVFREERWGTGEWSRPVYFFELVGDTVWGATAALLRQLLAKLTGTDPGGPDENDPAHLAPPDYQIPPGLDDEVF
ncbi:MAG: NUDIX hydrolase [Actinomycetes bacterium]